MTDSRVSEGNYWELWQGKGNGTECLCAGEDRHTDVCAVVIVVTYMVYSI